MNLPFGRFCVQDPSPTGFRHSATDSTCRTAELCGKGLCGDVGAADRK